MITVVYCTRETNPDHQEHIKKTSGLHKHIEVIEIINNGVSLTECYKGALEQAKYDIVVFLHDDIIIETKQWGRKLIKHYQKNPEYGILGVAGTKYLAETGKWWEDMTKMCGRVAHTHEGKTWLSKYSDDIGNRVEETILVDGVFFSVHKDRIKKDFDTEVKGFHFYDVDFCFQNYLEGVKVGVHTNIRVNHMSIGQTNDQWEENRKLFAEKYADNLPVKLKEDFKNRKLKVLIGCLNFQGLTGSEISTLETAKGLVKQGCDVSVISNIGPAFARIAKQHGIKTYSFENPPFYKVGDGKWSMRGANGNMVPSQPKTLYKVAQEDFDVIHANHTPITKKLLELYPKGTFVNIVRSEVIDLENPVIDERIKKYITIRPSIKEHIVENFDIPEDKVEVIYNPFDKDRFKPKEDPNNDKKVILFVGTMDYLRKNPIEDLIIKCSEDNKELWLVGKDTMGYAKELNSKHEHVKYFGESDKVEDFYHKCDETAGIFLGRTTIEGYLCNKPAWIYKVDKMGNILGHKFHEVPEDMSIFDRESIINNIKNVYIDVYNQ